MSAADFFNEPLLSSNGKVLNVISTEDDLEVLGRDTDAKVTQLQAHILGAEVRRRLLRSAGCNWDYLVADRAILEDDVSAAGEHSDTSTSLDPRDITLPTSNLETEQIRVEDEKNDQHSSNGPLMIEADFGTKRVDALPDGWVDEWTHQGHPFFRNHRDGSSMWMHPYQREASAIYGSGFNLVVAWLRHLDRGILPQGWQVHFDRDGKIFFQSSSTPQWGWLYPRTIAESSSGPMQTHLQSPSIEELALESAAKHFNSLLSGIAPWWVESPPKVHDSLCNVCCHIDFQVLLHQTDPYMYETPIPLGSLQTIERKNECSFCRLVSQTATAILGESLGMQGEQGPNIVCELDENPDWDRYTTRLRKLYLRLRLGGPHDEKPLLGYGWIQEIASPVNLPKEQRGNDCRFVNDQIDFALLKSWFRTCEQNHNDPVLEYNSTMIFSEGPSHDDPHTLVTQPCRPIPLTPISVKLKVIHVENECIVDISPDERYVALSYVWGGPQPFQNTMATEKLLSRPHGISIQNKTIPATIRDAMEVVALLGERYLWVDSLCIVQDDHESKMEQIANMGNIYSRAVLTIVAGAGDNANAGLPGIRPNTRSSTQFTAQVQGMILANEQPYMHDTIEQSKWFSRAWTYQERELSKRTLLFSEMQVY
jgi:hypothetical protein